MPNVIENIGILLPRKINGLPLKTGIYIIFCRLYHNLSHDLLNGWHPLCTKEDMQNVIADLANDLSPQTLGMTDPVSILGFSLIAPGLIIFAILLLAGSFRPRWRGYWDAV